MARIRSFALATPFLSFAPQIFSGDEVKLIPLVLTRIHDGIESGSVLTA
jgi:hypothetical protein